jgi:hypothetical protein
MADPQTLAEELGVANLTEALHDLRDRYIHDPAECERRNHAALIDAMLTHRGAYAVTDYLNRALVDPLNRQEHAALVGFCEVNALLRRVVAELATVYSEPAERTVGSGAEKFSALAKAIGLDLVMRGANRRLVAHESLWLSLRVRDDEPVLDVITPARFWAVSPAGDPTKLVGILTEIPRSPKAPPEAPAFRFSGRWQTLTLNAKCELLVAEENPLAPDLPGVLVHLEPPSVTQRLLPERANLDLVSAETASAFQVLISLREAMTVQRQAYISGDTGQQAMGQSASSQREIFLAEGVTVTAVDRSIDVKQYLAHSDALSDTAAANHGLAPATRKLESASSGYELWLRAQPLVQRRREQIDVLREAEGRLAAHMAKVIDAVGLEEYRYDPSGFTIQFGELSMPQSEQEELANFETRRRLGLDDTQSEIARRAQISDEQAAEDLATHVQRESARVALMQDLAAQNANMSTPVGDASNMNRDAAPVTGSEKATIQ